MKLTVLGASGGIGIELVRQALAAGHHVTAVVRATSRLEVDAHPSLEVVVADVLDPEAIAPAIAGRDAVLSALGPRTTGPTTIMTAGTQSILRAMESAGVRRLLVVSLAAIHTTGDDPFTRFVVKPILGRILRHSFADARAMEAEIRSSALDWTVVCPPRLRNGPAKGRIRSARERTIRGGFSITRADAAAYLLTALGDPTTTPATIVISN